MSATVVTERWGLTLAKPDRCAVCTPQNSKTSFSLQLALDEWSAEEVGRMEGGNAAVNREYEATMPVGAKRRSKEYSSRDQRNWFIKQKYEHRKWFMAHKGGELPQQEMAEKAKKKKKPAASVAATGDSFADDFGDLLNLSTPAMHSTSSSGTHASSNDSAWDPFGPSNTGVEQQPQGCLTAEASGGWGVRHSYVQQPGTSGVGGLAGGMGMQQQQQQYGSARGIVTQGMPMMQPTVPQWPQPQGMQHGMMRPMQPQPAPTMLVPQSSLGGSLRPSPATAVKNASSTSPTRTAVAPAASPFGDLKWK